jgi:serine/threonine protein kinase
VKFVFGAKIGSGGFGVVLHATRTEDSLPFAVKQLAPQHLDDEEVVRRFRREVRIQRGLTHPNILPIVAVNLATSPPWFVMPIAERTLLDEITASISEDEVERIFGSIMDAIEYAHGEGVVHRDLKPENVMMSHNNEPQVSDFGLGKNLLSDSTTLTRTHLGAGSFPYVSPEQMLSLGDADERSDVYALGKVLQAMVTASLPVLTNDPAAPRKYQYFISRCTAQQCPDRYQSVSEMKVAFAQLIKGDQEPRPARETADELINGWLELPAGDDLPAIRALHEFFERNVDDRALFQTVVPRLPRGLINQYVTELPNEFKRMIRVFDECVSGSLDFNYCDKVANFYRDVWRMTNDLEIRKLLLTRLVQMGYSHNRFHVGDVVAEILTEVSETPDVMMVLDVLRANRQEAAWLKPNRGLRATRLASPIDDELYGGDL